METQADIPKVILTTPIATWNGYAYKIPIKKVEKCIVHSKIQPFASYIPNIVPNQYRIS